MKKCSPILLLAALCGAPPIACATKPGDTAQEVLVERGQPEARITNGDYAGWIYRHDLIELRANRVSAVKSLVATEPPASAPPASAPISAPAAAGTPAAIKLPARPTAPPGDPVAAARAEHDAAVARVKANINQPVRTVSSSSQPVSHYPGWFHKGAITPDFDNVDIRQTQACDYDSHPFIANSEKPGLVFRGTDAEFNPMTKFFYVDRSLPKKKLTEAEMLEINRLYRIIGRTQKIIGEPAAQ